MYNVENCEGSSAKPEGPGGADDGDNVGLRALRVIRHDFKTPLTSLKMIGQIFQLGLEKGTLAEQPERTARNCRMLVEQVDKLVLLADNLYEISVLQSGHPELERQLADLRPVVKNALLRNESRLAGVDLPDEPIWGQWDTARLARAFSMLIAEASSVSIAVKVDRAAGVARVSLKGEFPPPVDKSLPGRYLAGVIVRLHGGTIDDRYEITLPLGKPA
ncbi:MAG: hypothetical protein HY075_07045 [Deltaproteobacteria bacterium]|nr:hypothetical protein [Deltaproteobacteria bacterium]